MAWARFFRRRRWHDERSREIEAYIETETAENIARGMPAHEALFAAHRKLGNPTLIREEIYRMNSVSFIEAIWQDLRYAIRQLRHSPGFTAAAVLSLALGIGANTAIFTLVDQVLLRRLPVQSPQELVQLIWRGDFYGTNISRDTLSYPVYRDLRDHNQVFSGVLAYHQMDFGAGFQGHTERILGELVTGNYFEVLGVGAALGRVFTQSDDLIPGAHPVAILSYNYWQNRFHADPRALGQIITVNSYPFTIVGVSAKGFDGLEVGNSPGILIPIAMRSQVTQPSWTAMFGLEQRRGRWVRVFGRLKPGVTAERAKASLQPFFHSILEMETRLKEFAAASAETRRAFLKAWLDAPLASQGRSGLREEYKTPLKVLTAIVGLVLLIACANVANLLLARATGRQRETAVRLAIGAGASRIARQALVESLLLAVLGGAAGLVLSMWTDRVLLDMLSRGDAPLALSTTPDPRVLAFTLAVSAITGLLFGLAPAFSAGRVDLLSALKEHAGAVAGGAAPRLRQSLVVAQVCLSTLLLIGASLFLRSLTNLRRLDPGFQTRNVIAFAVDPSLVGYGEERRTRLFRDLLDRLRAAPGVDSAALGIIRVAGDDWWGSPLTIPGYQSKPRAEAPNAACNGASSGYLATLGIGLIAGRDFSAADAASQHQVVLVNESFARKYLGGNARAVGRRVGFGSDPTSKADLEIVGVVRDLKYSTLRDESPRQLIVDSEQMKDLLAGTIYVKTRTDPHSMFSAIRRLVAALDPNLPVSEMRTMDDQVQLSLTSERLLASLASAFGLLATLLAAIGLYGLMSFSVVSRKREIGVRMALGARGGGVAWLVMKEILLLIGIGSAIALPAAWGLARLVESQLYGVAPSDPRTFAYALLSMVLVAALAGYLPARRATRVDPIQALRYE